MAVRSEIGPYLFRVRSCFPEFHIKMDWEVLTERPNLREGYGRHVGDRTLPIHAFTYSRGAR